MIESLEPSGQLRDALRARAGRHRRSPHARGARRVPRRRAARHLRRPSRSRDRSPAATASSQCGGAGWTRCSRSRCRASRRTPRTSCGSRPATGTTDEVLAPAARRHPLAPRVRLGRQARVRRAQRGDGAPHVLPLHGVPPDRRALAARDRAGPERSRRRARAGQLRRAAVVELRHPDRDPLAHAARRPHLARVRQAHARGRRRRDPPLLRLLDLRAAGERPRHDRPVRGAPRRDHRRDLARQLARARRLRRGGSPRDGAAPARRRAAARRRLAAARPGSGSTRASRRSTTCGPARPCRRRRASSARRRSHRT